MEEKPKCLNCGSTNLGKIDPADGTQDCLDCGSWNATPGLNIRFLAQGMIKVPFKDLPEGFYGWKVESQVGWANEFWHKLQKDDLVRGIAYLEPAEDSIIDCLEVDGWLKDEEYPFLAKTITWNRYWDSGRCKDLKPVDEIDKEDRVLMAAPKLLAALKNILKEVESWDTHSNEGRVIEWAEAAIKEAEGEVQPEDEGDDEGSLSNQEKCEDCVHGDPQGGDQPICTCPISSEELQRVRDELYRTGTCGYYAWKH